LVPQQSAIPGAATANGENAARRTSPAGPASDQTLERSLLDLPLEMLENVANQLEPRDLLALHGTSQQLWGATHSALPVARTADERARRMSVEQWMQAPQDRIEAAVAAMSRDRGCSRDEAEQRAGLALATLAAAFNEQGRWRNHAAVSRAANHLPDDRQQEFFAQVDRLRERVQDYENWARQPLLPESPRTRRIRNFLRNSQPVERLESAQDRYTRALRQNLRGLQGWPNKSMLNAAGIEREDPFTRRLRESYMRASERWTGSNRNR
jgi:hypothetical protein